MYDQIIIEEYLNSSIEDIELSIGRIILANETQRENEILYPSSISTEDVKKVCDDFIDSISEKLKQKICIDFNYNAKKNQESLNDNMNLVISIVSLINDISGIIPPLMIATLLVKKGLSKFCEEK